MSERFSICGFTLLTTPFEQQLEAIAAAGAGGYGVCEALIPEGMAPAEVRSALDRAGLRATVCLPALLAPLPLPRFEGPEDPEERIAGLQESARRFAALEPQMMAILTGPPGDRDAGEARALALDGIARVNDVAKTEGVRLGLEPIYRADAGDWSLVWDIPGALALLDELADDNIGLLVDSFHLWDTPDLEAHIRAAGPRIAGVHVNDRGSDHRSWADRRVPGTGVIDLAGYLRACEDAGYTGHYDCEIFSDDGSLGVADYPDSLWKQDGARLARDCTTAFDTLADTVGIQ